MSRRAPNLLLAGVVVLVAVAGTGPRADAGGSVKRCHGKPATINNTDSAFIRGTGGADVIIAGPGAHQIVALGGDDVICAGPGADVLAGGPGSDTIDGGNGADLIYGNGGDDSALGRAGDDVMDGKSGTDSCTGGPGHDLAARSRCERISGADLL